MVSDSTISKDELDLATVNPPRPISVANCYPSPLALVNGCAGVSPSEVSAGETDALQVRREWNAFTLATKISFVGKPGEVSGSDHPSRNSVLQPFPKCQAYAVRKPDVSWEQSPPQTR